MYTFLLSLHILSATIWSGGHLVLALSILPKVLKESNVELLQEFEELYEKVGMPALVVQVLTGLYLAYNVEPEISKWFSFSGFSGAHIGLKIVLLTMTVALALNAKFRVIPNLNASTLKIMAFHIIAVTVISIIFVLVGVSYRTGGFIIIQ